jgi:hypothetical protein
VFVTALVPGSFLNSLAARPSANRSFKVMSQMAAANPDALVLVDLTSSGWEPVENGQLMPYATGVLGDQLAAQTILSNTDTSGLAGSQFCLGYGTGTDASEMTDAERMQLIAIVPDSNATNVNTRTCNVTLPISDDQVFSYAEANYPSFFPLASMPGQLPPYNYRYYPATGNYLAVDDANVIYIYGLVSSYTISPVGSVESFRSTITNWEATLPP